MAIIPCEQIFTERTRIRYMSAQTLAPAVKLGDHGMVIDHAADPTREATARSMGRDRDAQDETLTGADRPFGSGRPFHRASIAARATLRRVSGTRGFAETEVLTRWPEIVGADLAPRCRPVKVFYADRSNLGATLVVRTDSGHAPEVEHLGPKFVERVNRFYGYGAISRVRVTQSGPADLSEDRSIEESGASVEPTSRDREEAESLVAGIRSPGLRAALARMGASVLARVRAGHVPDDDRH